MQYSIRTEQGYVDWCRRILAFHGEVPTARLGVEEGQRFLNHLAVDRSVPAKLILYKPASLTYPPTILTHRP